MCVTSKVLQNIEYGVWLIRLLYRYLTRTFNIHIVFIHRYKYTLVQCGSVGWLMLCRGVGRGEFIDTGIL